MYLSQCVVNSTRPINPYQLHKKIWRLFPEQEGEERSFLFRVENLGQIGVQKILLQSEYKPQQAEGDLVLLQHKTLDYSALTEGLKLRFIVRANPTKKIKDPQGKSTNQGRLRVPLIDEIEIMAWLKRQLQPCADIQGDELSLLRQDLLSFRKVKGQQQHFGKIQTVTYTGLMTLTDVAALNQIIVAGIGPAKAFGCGLLSIAKA